MMIKEININQICNIRSNREEEMLNKMKGNRIMHLTMFITLDKSYDVRHTTYLRVNDKFQLSITINGN
jgi:hypothetical protein